MVAAWVGAISEGARILYKCNLLILYRRTDGAQLSNSTFRVAAVIVHTSDSFFKRLYMLIFKSSICRRALHQRVSNLQPVWGWINMAVMPDAVVVAVAIEP